MNSSNQMFPFQVILCHLKNSKYVQTNRHIKSVLSSEIVTCTLLKTSWSVSYQIDIVKEWTWWLRTMSAFFWCDWNCKKKYIFIHLLLNMYDISLLLYFFLHNRVFVKMLGCLQNRYFDLYQEVIKNSVFNETYFMRKQYLMCIICIKMFTYFTFQNIMNSTRGRH